MIDMLNTKAKHGRMGFPQEAVRVLVREASRFPNIPSSHYCSRIGYDSHAAYIASPEWRATKQRYMQSGMPVVCLICLSRETCLHHLSYRSVGNEPLSDLIPLCHQHHHELHQFLNMVNVPVEWSIQSLRVMLKWSWSQVHIAFHEYNTKLICAAYRSCGFQTATRPGHKKITKVTASRENIQDHCQINASTGQVRHRGRFYSVSAFASLLVEHNADANAIAKSPGGVRKSRGRPPRHVRMRRRAQASTSND